MPIQAVVFDLDGTLSNTLNSIAGFANEALQTYGLPAIEVDTYRILIGEGRDNLIRRMILRTHGSDDETLYRMAYESLAGAAEKA